MKIKTNLTINGNGTSLWGESKGEFKINEVSIVSFSDGYATIELFGPTTKWSQYTDDLIAKEVNEKVKPVLAQYFNEKAIKKITWSEQGMQPDNGWNFDVVFYKRKVK